MKTASIYFCLLIASGSFFINKSPELTMEKIIISNNITPSNQVQTDSVKRVAKKMLSDILKKQIEVLENNQSTKQNLIESKNNLLFKKN